VARSHDILFVAGTAWWASALSSELGARKHNNNTDSNTCVDPQHSIDTAHAVTNGIYFTSATNVHGPRAVAE
jgi:hypothetical protein